MTCSRGGLSTRLVPGTGYHARREEQQWPNLHSLARCHTLERSVCVATTAAGALRSRDDAPRKATQTDIEYMGSDAVIT